MYNAESIRKMTEVRPASSVKFSSYGRKIHCGYLCFEVKVISKNIIYGKQRHINCKSISIYQLNIAR